MSMYGKYAGKVGPLKPADWPVTDCTGDKGFTVQADRDEADINKIVSRMLKTGQVPPVAFGVPFYGDVSEFGDLQDSLMKIQEAERLFGEFPADVRERFDNNYVKMIEFLDNPDNLAEARELGIVQKAPPPEVPPVVPAAAGDPV